MKPVFAIPLFLLVLPMVAAEAPMSYVRFTTPDPLALSYPSLSPYAYCAYNPVNNVDLDGKKIRFAKGVPSEFKQQFSTAIKILNEHNIGGIFAKLEQRPEIIFITEGKNQFDPSNNTINWNPTEGMISSPEIIYKRKMK